MSKAKNAWPKVKRTINHGKPVWLADARKNGIGPRQFFPTKKQAEEWAETFRTDLATHGTKSFEEPALAAFDLQPRDAIKFALDLHERYFHELRGYGKTIADALEIGTAHFRRLYSSVPLIDAIAELVRSKRLAGKSDDYCQRLAYRPGRLLTAYPVEETRTREQILDLKKIFPKLAVSDDPEQAVNVGKALSAYTTEDLESFLSQFEQPGTRNTFRRDLCTLWSFGSANARKWCDASVATDIEIVESGEEFEEIEILAVKEVQSLLLNGDEHTIPGTVIAGFSNLRQSELIKRANKKPGEKTGQLLRLDWSDVHLDERVVVVGAKLAKTKKRRTVEIPENAVEWLLPYARKSGPVVPTDFRYRFDIARVKSGFTATAPGRHSAQLQALLRDVSEKGIVLKPWPNNGLRHSAISYKVALTRDIAKVATESGNSPAVIAEHYLNLVMPSAAAAYYDIRPPAVEVSAFTVEQMRQILSLGESSSDEEVETAWAKRRRKRNR
ncbi:MAG TPA: site-specific integrase [Chthoniobacterales bacterium]|jgi:integrase